MAKHRKYNGGSGKSSLEYRNSMNAKQVQLNQIGGKIFNLPFQSTGGSDPSTKTAGYSLVPTDAGKTVIMNVSTGSALVTVPPQSSQTFTANAKIDIVQTGSVQVEIVPGSGVTINSKNSNKKIAAQYSGATLIRVSSDSWVLIGDLIA